MKDAKRYDAVHLRYEDSNIRYGEGCEVEVVAAYDYDALKAICDELMGALDGMVGKAQKQNWRDNYPSEIEAAYAALDRARGEA